MESQGPGEGMGTGEVGAPVRGLRGAGSLEVTVLEGGEEDLPQRPEVGRSGELPQQRCRGDQAGVLVGEGWSRGGL